MAYPVAPGKTGFSGTYIPEIWSTNMLIKFYKNTCLSEISNTDYEGEISGKGDKVKIRTVPDIAIKDHVDGMDLVYDDVSPGLVELLIDHGKYFAFPASVIEKAQSDIAFMEKFSEDGSMQMKIAIESDVYANVYTDAAAANSGNSAGLISGDIALGQAGAPLELTKSNVLDFIVDLGTVMDEQNIPETERFLLLPARMCGLIKKSDLKDASITGDGTSLLRNGKIGGIDRFTIYSSNCLSRVIDGTTGRGCWNVMAGHKSALTFAAQISENETLKNPKNFGDLVRALKVYGYKVIKPEALAHAYVGLG